MRTLKSQIKLVYVFMIKRHAHFDGQFQPAIQQQSIAMQMLRRSSPQFKAATLRIERYRAEKDYQQNQTDRIPFFVK